MSSPRLGLSLLVVAGEASGDLHASQLCRQLRELSSQPIEIWGSGGERLSLLGARLLASAHELAAIGPVAAVRQLRKYYKLYRAILKEVEARRPDLAILVDFPDFNLPLARSLKKRGVAPVVYFISPQLWAWRAGRVRRVRRSIDKMVVVLPFEVDFYRTHGICAEYFGHPLASRRLPRRDRQQFFQQHGIEGDRILVAVLPGSRQREVEAILPPVLQGAALLARADQQRLQLVVSEAPGMKKEVNTLVAPWLHRLDITVVEGSEEVLAHCDYGLIKSGTATLEAALAGIPFCVIYRGSYFSWFLVKWLVRTEHYALPNLILAERAVPELIQSQLNARAVAEMLSSFVHKDRKWETIRQKLSQVKERLFAEDPYREAARSVMQLLGNCQ